MQQRTNPFIVMAGLYLTVGLLAVMGKLAIEGGVVESLPRLRWLTIHFVTIGGMTQALFGLLPSLTNSITAEDQTPKRQSRWWQWLLLNVGYPLILLGMATGSMLTAIAGATIVLTALGLLIVTVYRVGTQNNTLFTYYRVAPWFLVVGIFAAFGMLLNVHGPGGYFGSIEAHVHANVWGFLALVVTATLLTLLPSLLDADLRYPRLVPVTFWGVTFGAVGLVAGPWLARHELTMLGLAIYVVGTLAFLANVVGTYIASDRRQSKRVGLVLGAYLWLVFPVPWAPLVLLYPDTVPGGAIEIAAIDGLVFGWMLQLAMAFLPVMALASQQSMEDQLAETVASVAERISQPSWIQVGSVNLGMFALWMKAFPTFDTLAETLTLAGYMLIAVAWLLFVISFWTSQGASGRNYERGDKVHESA